MVSGESTRVGDELVVFSPGMISSGLWRYRLTPGALGVGSGSIRFWRGGMRWSKRPQDFNDLEIQIALVETEVDGAVEAELHRDPVARLDASGLAFGDLPEAVLIADGEVVVDRAGGGLGEQGLQVRTLG